MMENWLVLSSALGKRSSRALIRALCYPSVPLNKAVDVDHTSVDSSYISYQFGSKTKITTLDNGLRVASQQSFGQYCTVGGNCLN